MIIRLFDFQRKEYFFLINELLKYVKIEKKTTSSSIFIEYPRRERFAD